MTTTLRRRYTLTAQPKIVAIAAIAFFFTFKSVLATDGNFTWSTAICDEHDATCIGDTHGLTVPPLLVESTLLCTCPHGRIVAVNYDTGKRLWESPAHGAVHSNGNGVDLVRRPTNHSEPALIGRSLVAHYDGVKRRLNAYEVMPSGRLIWGRSFEQTIPSGNFLFEQSCRMELGYLAVFHDFVEYHTLDGTSGESLFSFRLPLNAQCNPTSRGDCEPFVSSRLLQHEKVVLGIHGFLYSVDVHRKTFDWSRIVPSDFGTIRSICVISDTVVVVSDEQCMLLSEITGVQKWLVRGLDSCHSIPTKTNIVLFRNGRGEAYDVQTGQLRWSLECKTKSISGNPCVLGNVVVVPIEERTLLFIGESSGRVVHAVKCSSGIGSVFGVNRDLVCFDGHYVRKLEFGKRSVQNQNTFRITTAPLTVDGYKVDAHVIVEESTRLPSSEENSARAASVIEGE